MLATRIRQKEGTFYFVAYKAAALLERPVFAAIEIMNSAMVMCGSPF